LFGLTKFCRLEDLANEPKGELRPDFGEEGALETGEEGLLETGEDEVDNIVSE
jgi:hypothetical protein